MQPQSVVSISDRVRHQLSKLNLFIQEHWGGSRDRTGSPLSPAPRPEGQADLPAARQPFPARFPVIMGTVFLLLGQSILLFPEIDFVNYGIASRLENTLRLGMPEFSSRLTGLLLLILGSGLMIFTPGRPHDPGSRINRTWKTILPGLPGSRWLLPLILTLGSSVVLLTQLYHQHHEAYLAGIWLFSLAPVIVFALRMDRQAQVQLSPCIKRQDLVFILSVALIGLGIGIYRLEGVPNFLMGDEGAFWSTSRDIASGEYRPPILDFGVYTYPILSSIYQAAVLKLSGVTLWSWRFSSVLAAILAVPPLYLLARELFDRKIAFLSALVMISSPYYLAFSRLGYNNSQTLLPVTLAIYFAYMGYKRRSVFYLLLAGFAAGMGFYTFTAAQSGLVIPGLFTGILLFRKGQEKRSIILAGLIILTGWFLVASPLRAYGLGRDPAAISEKFHESIFFNSQHTSEYLDPSLAPEEQGIFFGGGKFFFSVRIWATMIARGIVRTIFVFQTPGLVTEHMIAAPLAGSAGSLFFFLGLVSSLSGARQNRHQILLCWYAVTILALSVLNASPPRQTHMVGMIPLMAIWTGTGTDIFVGKVTRAFSWNSRKVYRLFLASICILIMTNGLTDYFIKMPYTYRPNQEDIMNWAGLYNPETRFLYLEEDGDGTFKPYIMREIRPEIIYENIRLDDLDSALAQKDNDPWAVFYHPEGREADSIIDPAAAVIFKETYKNREGEDILHAASNNPDFMFGIKQGFTNELNDSFRPGSAIALALLLILTLFTHFFQLDWIKRLAEPVQRFILWASERQRLSPSEPEIPPAVPEAGTAAAEHSSGAEEPELSPPAARIPESPPDHSTGKLPEDEIRPEPRFIEFEFKMRINLGSRRRVIGSGSGSQLTLKQLLRWISSLKQKPSGPETAPEPLEHPGLLGAGLLLAITAQVSLSAHCILPGALLYLIAIGLLLKWAARSRQNPAAPSRTHTTPLRTEIILVLVVLTAGIFARFYQAGGFPYGIDGDESKWGLQAFYSVVQNTEQGIFQHHFAHQPVSFYLIGSAMRLLGINLITPRYLNAFLSSLSLVFFYFGLRRAVNHKPIALAGTFLYAVSFTALSAGRQALHGSYIELWVNLAFWSLLLGLDTRSIWAMAVTGTALAFGSLTYETFYPVLAVFILYALIRLWPERSRVNSTAAMLFGLLFPVALILPDMISYIDLRKDYHLSGFPELASRLNPDSPWAGYAQAFFFRLGESLENMFISIGQPDFLLSWHGPIVNPWIVPFLIVGLAMAAYHRKFRHYLLLVLWFFIAFFGFSLMGAGYPRVLFAAVMPMYALSGFGLVTACRLACTISLNEPAWKRNAVKAGFVFLLALIAFVDIRIFTTSLDDSDERKQRRELYETFLSSLESSTFILLPYRELDNNAAFLEKEVLDMLAAGASSSPQPGEQFQVVTIQEVLPVLYTMQDLDGEVSLIIEKNLDPEKEVLSGDIETILSCYPDHSAVESRYFQTYLLHNPGNYECFSLYPPEPAAPGQGQIIEANSPILFQWDSKHSQVEYEVTIQELNSGIIRMEAEEMQGNGWYAETLHAIDFSGSAYLTDNFGAGPVSQTLEIDSPGTYTVWVRSYRRVCNDQVNYLSLGQDEPVEIARCDEESLNRWIWETAGAFDLQPGPQTITASRTYGSDPQFSVFLDEFILASDPDFNPVTSEIWTTILSHQAGHAGQTEYELAPGLPEGEYRWWISLARKPGLINWQGGPEIRTPPVGFRTAASP